MSNGNGRKSLEFYLSLRYPFTIYPAEEGGYVAQVQELPGCMTQGETIEEVVEFIEDARRSWIEATYNMGQDIPLPQTMEEFSGRFLVRLPKYLHRRLAEAAHREGVSLNQYVATLLSTNTLADEILHKLEALTHMVCAPEQRPSVTALPTSLRRTIQWGGFIITAAGIGEEIGAALSLSSRRAEASEQVTLRQRGAKVYALAP